MLHLVELDKELRHHPCDEDKLCETLHEQGLYRLATRLMQLMSDKTGLTEGFMPMPPLNDRTTKRMRIQVENRMSI